MQKVQKQELIERIEKLHSALNAQSSEWGAAFIVAKVNQYYFTGTMQDGVFILKRDGTYAYFARNSFERARQESPLDNIYPMTGYKSACDIIGDEIGAAFIETEMMPFAMLERMKKYFKISEILAADRAILNTRAVKSEYELGCMKESGRQHNILMESIVPGLLREGMNEAELTGEIFREMIRLGHHGVTKFSMFQMDVIVGQLGFGTNSLYPTNFDGAGGMKGMSAAVPIIGDRSRTLKKGDLVFVDVGYGFNGYHTDRTQIYFYGANPPQEVTRAHNECLQIQKQLAAAVKPGAIPSEIYNNAGFMNRNVKFLGHGIGLYMDEFPIIADRFNQPLRENMTIALEPKMGIEGVGLVGGEDTYVVTEQGGKCLTGAGEREIMVVL
jgi:Xaa-Pro aminopeptidase